MAESPKQKNLVLMRGLIRNENHWGEFKNSIQQILPDFRILCFSIPGTGPYHQMRSLPSIHQNVLFLRERFLRSIDPKDENYIISISLGGMITMNWLDKFPSDFKKAIIMNSSFGGVSPFYKRLQPTAMLEVFKIILNVKSLEKRQELIFNLACNLNRDKNKVIEHWTAIEEQYPVTAANALRQIYAASRYRICRHKPDAEILLLAGEKDRMVDYTCSTSLAKRWNLPIEVHPTAGHELPLDDSQWCLEHIKNFFLRNQQEVSSQKPTQATRDLRTSL